MEIISVLKGTTTLDVENPKTNIEIPFIKCLKLTGKDAMSFINNTSSFYVKKIKEGSCERGLFLNKFGKILIDGYLYKLYANTLYLVVFDYKLDEFIKYLNNLILINDVKIERIENFIYIANPSNITNLNSEIQIYKPNPEQSEESQDLIGKGFYVTSNDVFFIGQTNIQYESFKLDDKATINSINSLRLKNKIPYAGIDFDENTLANEVIDWVNIDISKGCFIGQEYVARVKFRGKIHKKLVYFSARKQILDDNINDILQIKSSYYDDKTDEVCGFGYLTV